MDLPKWHERPDSSEKKITDELFKKWWILNLNWDGYSPNKYIINTEKLNELAQGLIYLKYN